MKDQKEQPNHKHLMYTCAWCHQYISPEGDTFGFGAKASRGVNLEDKEGEFVSLSLALENKTTFAMVTPKESPAWQAGYDLMFITCSQSCAEDLKNALDVEKEVFEDR
jgi:hypothetical protein